MRYTLSIGGRRFGKRYAYEQGLLMFKALGYKVEEHRAEDGRAGYAVITKPKEK